MGYNQLLLIIQFIELNLNAISNFLWVSKNTNNECFLSSSTESLNSTLSKRSNKTDQDPEVIITNNDEDISIGADISSHNDGDISVTPDASYILEENSSEDSPPVPPPRPKRRNRTKLKKLSLENTNQQSFQEDSHQNDILFRTDSTIKLNKDNNGLKGINSPNQSLQTLQNLYSAGYISVLTLTTGGLRSQWKQRWVCYDSSQCKLKLYKVSN